MEFNHKPVLLEECIEGLDIKPEGVYVDGTLGGAGHSSEILKRLSTKGVLVGIDQDEFAIETSRRRLNDVKAAGTFELIKSNFENIKDACRKNGFEEVDGILLDLGVSSHQLDEIERGFSYMKDAPLDMRMDRGLDISAEKVVNEYGEQRLKNIIRDYGEEKWASRVAEFIVAARKEKKIATTFELVDIIKAAIPSGARREGPHPAKRTFQALRIEVNNELGILPGAIIDAVSLLRDGGRLCIITFHSLEDRIVKNEFNKLVNPCTCPPAFPVCICGNVTKAKLINRKPIQPSEMELEENPRSRSAKLRILQKIKI